MKVLISDFDKHAYQYNNQKYPQNIVLTNPCYSQVTKLIIDNKLFLTLMINIQEGELRKSVTPRAKK